MPSNANTNLHSTRGNRLPVDETANGAPAVFSDWADVVKGVKRPNKPDVASVVHAVDQALGLLDDETLEKTAKLVVDDSQSATQSMKGVSTFLNENFPISSVPFPIARADVPPGASGLAATITSVVGLSVLAAAPDDTVISALKKCVGSYLCLAGGHDWHSPATWSPLDSHIVRPSAYGDHFDMERNADWLTIAIGHSLDPQGDTTERADFIEQYLEEAKTTDFFHGKSIDDFISDCKAFEVVPQVLRPTLVAGAGSAYFKDWTNEDVGAKRAPSADGYEQPHSKKQKRGLSRQQSFGGHFGYPGGDVGDDDDDDDDDDGDGNSGVEFVDNPTSRAARMQQAKIAYQSLPKPAQGVLSTLAGATLANVESEFDPNMQVTEGGSIFDPAHRCYRPLPASAGLGINSTYFDVVSNVGSSASDIGLSTVRQFITQVTDGLLPFGVTPSANLITAIASFDLDSQCLRGFIPQAPTKCATFTQAFSTPTANANSNPDNNVFAGVAETTMMLNVLFKALAPVLGQVAAERARAVMDEHLMGIMVHTMTDDGSLWSAVQEFLQFWVQDFQNHAQSQTATAIVKARASSDRGGWAQIFKDDFNPLSTRALHKTEQIVAKAVMCDNARTHLAQLAPQYGDASGSSTKAQPGSNDAQLQGAAGRNAREAVGKAMGLSPNAMKKGSWWGAALATFKAAHPHSCVFKFHKMRCVRGQACPVCSL
jgi:hypothetical protein